MELIKDKDQDTDVQDDKLHRNFKQAVENKSEATFRNRFTAQIAAHLRLIGTKIAKE